MAVAEQGAAQKVFTTVDLSGTPVTSAAFVVKHGGRLAVDCQFVDANSSVTSLTFTLVREQPDRADAAGPSSTAGTFADVKHWNSLTPAYEEGLSYTPSGSENFSFFIDNVAPGVYKMKVAAAGTAASADTLTMWITDSGEI